MPTELIDANGWDAVILGANLNGVTEPVAEQLRRRGVPFLVLSGYSPDQMKGALADAPFPTKPSGSDTLLSAVRALHH